MKILVLGSGLMGPAAAYNAMTDPDVEQVTLCDLDAQQLDQAQHKLRELDGAEKVTAVALDLNDQEAATHLMAGYDAVVAALPNTAIPAGLRAAAAAGKPWVDLSWPPAGEQDDLRKRVKQAGTLAVMGCGVEPGLTEIVARYLAERLDRTDELHIRCGGIPEKPAPPLGYKIVFGGRRLPLREHDAQIAQDGRITPVPRYSGVETFRVAGVGEVEAWHEGFMPWLLDLKALKGLKLGTQKTVRWPGYAAKATALRELGFLSQTPIEVGGVSIAPKQFLDTLLYPHVKMDDDERDLTVFSVEVIGERKGRPRRLRVEMVDRYDNKLGFTSMARVTAFTGAIVARMIARGDIKEKGWVTPEQVITGKRFKQLMRELEGAGVHFDLVEERTKAFKP